MPQQKAQYVQGWFISDPQGLHPEHPIVLPPGGPGGPGDPGKPPIDPGLHPEHPIVLPPEGGKPPIDPGLHPEHPIVIPPLPPVWPPPGEPAHPIVIPPTQGPIYIVGPPDRPVQSDPGTLQPDLPAGSVPMGKVALLIEVVGVPGKRWLTYATEAQPKP